MTHDAIYDALNSEALLNWPLLFLGVEMFPMNPFSSGHAVTPVCQMSACVIFWSLSQRDIFIGSTCMHEGEWLINGPEGIVVISCEMFSRVDICCRLEAIWLQVRTIWFCYLCWRKWTIFFPKKHMSNMTKTNRFREKTLVEPNI